MPPIAPRHAKHAIVEMTPQDNAIIESTSPAVALPSFPFFKVIAAKTIPTMPQMEPIHPIPAAPIPMDRHSAMIPKTKDATAIK